MTDKEQIIIDGKGCRYKTWDKDCALTGDNHGDNMKPCKFIDEKNCYYKQLKRKEQECEQIKEKYEALKLENQEGYEIVAELKHECEELKERLERIEEDLKYQCVDCMNIKSDRYRKALEEIEKIAKDGLNPICYKSNCSRCKCYNGDDCKAGMISLINNYFTKNGEFADGNGDFAEALEDLLDKERSRCNRALPISKKILDIINKTKGEGICQ